MLKQVGMRQRITNKQTKISDNSDIPFQKKKKIKQITALLFYNNTCQDIYFW
jgi:hypothetical protein